jgi:hypothetical protein
MMKLLGFVVAISVLMLALRSDLFFGTAALAEPEKERLPTWTNRLEAEKEKTFYAELSASKANQENSNIDNAEAEIKAEQADKKAEQKDKAEAKTVQYAEGYDAKSFGKAFEDPLEGTTTAELQKQPEGVWKTLLRLTFDIKYDERVDDIVFKPMFTADIRKLENKEITIQGYILPHDITKMGGGKGSPNDGSMFIFSAYPAATCFYCGGAGPESVIEVYPSAAIPFSKQLVTIKGKLELNETDFLQLAYKLKNAKLAD